MTFYSQYTQDEFLEKNVFKGFKNGIFVDVGAHDGKCINNTLYFEEQHQWKGINIEPLQEIYNRLIVNRPTCVNLNCAISNENGTAEFIANQGYTEMLSGLLSEYEKAHHQRGERERRQFGGTSQIITVPTRRLDSIFQEYNLNRIHYLSIDVEGAEFKVIQSIDFSKIFIDVISFENNYPNSGQGNAIQEYLKTMGYITIQEGLDIVMIHQNSTFRELIDAQNQV